MTEFENKKEVLIQKITMHRRLLDLELESFKEKMRPITSIFSLGQEASNTLDSIGSLFKTLSGNEVSASGKFNVLGNIIPAVTPVVKFLLGKAKKQN